MRGVLESVAPTAAFLVAVTAGAPLTASAVGALVVCLVLVAWRLVARQPVAPSVGGAVLVGVCVVAALRSGSTRDFYAPGLVINAAYAVALLASLLPWPAVGSFTGGSVPAVGLVLGAARGGSMQWRREAGARRRAARLTWLWVGLFAVRLAVELPLYLAGEVTALGVARLVLGLPAFAVLAWVTLAARPITWPPPAPPEPGATRAPSRSPAP